MEEEESIREENIKSLIPIRKNWFKNPYNLTFIAILAFTIIFRLHYFILTKTQPLWWDEAEYMSLAKSFAGIINFDYTWGLNRFPGFPALVSLFYTVGINNEIILRFLVAFIPSIIAILLMYFVIISMYSDKRISLISTAIFSVLWEHVFFSNRFHTENMSLIFEFLAIIVLFYCYLKNKDLYFIKSKYSLIWVGIFSILCIVFRSGNMILVPVIFLFLLLVNLYRVPDKYRTYSILGLIGTGIISFILFRFLSGAFPLMGRFYNFDAPLAWKALYIFYGFYQSLLLGIPSIFIYSFFLGIILFLFSFFLIPEKIKNTGKNISDNSYKADIFNIILIVAVLFFFIFIIKSSGEYRWFFVLLPGMFAFTSKGIIKTSEFIASFFKIKYLSLIIIISLVLLGMYTQYYHADVIIKNKLTSYQEVKDSGLWMKENLNKAEIIVSASFMQHSYYGERKIYNINEFPSEEDFLKFIKEKHPGYLILSVFETHPLWSYDLPIRQNQTFYPIKAYFSKQDQTQPILIIYKITNSSL